jgi:drug/metabolite transporter (DMT)-like permease
VSHHLAAGVLVSVLSTVLYNVGFVLEKHGLEELPAVHARRIVHLVATVASSPTWVLGFCSMLGGLALQVVALSMAPISVVQPILVSGMVLLLGLSHVTLGERLGRREWVAIGLVATALLCISLSLDLASDRVGTTGHLSTLALAALPTVLVTAGAFTLADHFGGHWLHPNARAATYGVSTGLLYGVSGLAVKAVAAIVARHGVWLAIPHVLASGYLYAFVCMSGLGLLLFQTALQRCSASVVVPVSNVVSSTYVVALGTVIFGEHLPASGWKLALRAAGFAAVLLGVLLLARARPTAPRHQSGEPRRLGATGGEQAGEPTTAQLGRGFPGTFGGPAD